MAYFIPSYFQKRLLRYALSRLDVIETNDLDLDNLGITFGQRSVVELKNVALKIGRLVALVPLPSHVVPTHATVRRLRVTVPADLHASGIIVEIDAVEVRVRLQDVESEKSQSGKAEYPRSGQRHGDSADRLRKDSNTLHDSQGPAEYGRHGTQHIHILPTSEDLAVSFLEAEPLPERRELEAVIGSQSQHVSSPAASTASLGNDTGLGMPGGFSLPTFVADFFQGVSDRLSIQTRNITLVLEMQNKSQQPVEDCTRVILRVKEVNLEGVKLRTNTDCEPQRRSFVVHGLEVLLHSNTATTSKSSSPRLTRSSTKLSSSSPSDPLDSSKLRQSEKDPLGLNIATSRMSLSNEIQASLQHKSFSAEEHPSPRNEDSPMDTYASFLASQHLRSSHASLSSSLSSQFQSTVFHSGDDIDNRAHAEEVVQSHHAGPHESSSPIGDAEETQDLAQSKIFSHHDAESMYMSAVADDPGWDSTVRPMPGAWDWETSEPTSTGPDRPSQAQASAQRQSEKELEVSSVPKLVPGDEKVANKKKTAGSGKLGGALTALPAHDETGFSSNYKRVVYMSRINAEFPASTNDEHEIAQQQQPVYKAQSLGTTGNRTDQSGAASVLDPSFSRFRPHGGQSPSRTPEHKADSDLSCTIVLDIGDVNASLDMHVARCVVDMLQYLPKTDPPQDRNSIGQAKTALPPASLKMNALTLGIYEQLDIYMLSDVTEGECVTANPEVPMLYTIFSDLAFDSSRGSTQQQLTITKIKVQHMGSEVLSFIDTLNVRDSIATSAMLKPYDITLNGSDGRLEIHTKPVHIKLDLLAIDDVLSRSGGLSTLLDLGASIASVSTFRDGVPERNPARRRSVRFNAPTPRPRSDSGSGLPGSKINVRLSGALIDLIGSESSIKVKSAAVKLAYRGEAARLAIDGAALEGPWINGIHADPAMFAKVKNIDVIYRNTPDEEQDLDRLLSLITPSKNEYDQDDDIMIDTLLKQRRKGAVIRLAISEIQASVNGFAWKAHLNKLVDELSKLSSVTKYLPDDDRPGVLTFVLISKTKLRINASPDTRPLQFTAELLEGAHINVPSLLAVQVAKLALTWEEKESIAGEVIEQSSQVGAPPMLMCRFIADEMEPTIRLKVSNLCVEYKVSTLLALKKSAESVQSQLGALPVSAYSPLSSPISSESHESSPFSRKVAVSVSIADSAIALYPADLPAKGLLLLSDMSCAYHSHRKQTVVNSTVTKASILIIDDVEALGRAEGTDHRLYFDQNDQVQQLTKAGFVPVTSVTSAVFQVRVHEATAASPSVTDVEVKNGLLFLETCADSTQTLFQILGGLSPPSPPSVVAKYRTEIVPLTDMLASFTGDAYVTEPGPELGLQASHLSGRTSNTESAQSAKDLQDSQMSSQIASTQFARTESGDEDEVEDDPSNFGFMNDADLDDDDEEDDDRMSESYAESEIARSTASGSIHVAPVAPSIPEEETPQQSVVVHSLLNFQSDHFQEKSTVGGTAHKWYSTKDTYGLSSEKSFDRAPLKVRLRGCNVIWHLFDGYDWQKTRERISQAVKDIEAKAMIQRPKSLVPGVEGEEEAVIGDFLFHSIYIGIPANRDPKDLTNAINQEIDDVTSETGSYATGTTVTATPSGRQASTRLPKIKPLRLSRSKHHKISFNLEGLSADIVVFPPDSGEIENSIDVRINKLDIFDHLPTSTWRKFATYMHEAGEREVDTPQVHIEMLNVKPMPDLSASEIVLKLSVLPLRLHVDQDALDFMARFFEFKDEREGSPATTSSTPFIQRAEVNPIRLKLDFKPKRVDYRGLRSGRTTEFMNFFVLDRADMVLRRVILYGVSGFDRLGIMLNNIWSPDVRRNQLPGVLAGLAPIRSLVDVGSGVKDLVAIPIREYRKDGRVVRSIQKGALVFAKTTTTELLNLGAKLAIGTQQVLQNTEEMLVPQPDREGDEDEESKRQISLYADQPVGIVQGLRGAYASLERDLLLAKGAIIAVPGEFMAASTAQGAAKAVLKQSPTIILRPAIGATKAIGQTLLGAGNTLDRSNLRKVEDKYKRH